MPPTMMFYNISSVYFFHQYLQHRHWQWWRRRWGQQQHCHYHRHHHHWHCYIFLMCSVCVPVLLYSSCSSRWPHSILYNHRSCSVDVFVANARERAHTPAHVLFVTNYNGDLFPWLSLSLFHVLYTARVCRLVFRSIYRLLLQCSI